MKATSSSPIILESVQKDVKTTTHPHTHTAHTLCFFLPKCSCRKWQGSGLCVIQDAGDASAVEVHHSKVMGTSGVIAGQTASPNPHLQHLEAA